MFIRVLNCESLKNKKNMPCLPLCRLNLSIVQNRYVRTWIMSTINLLENSAGLYQFTLELPWPGFTPESITYLIRQFNEYHASVHNRIRSLTRMSASGCSLCRSRQRQAQNPQHWLGTRSSPWNQKQNIFKNCNSWLLFLILCLCRLLAYYYCCFLWLFQFQFPYLYLHRTDPTQLNVCKT